MTRENNGVRGKLLFVVNDFGFFVSHRLAVGVGARDAGFDVYVAAPGEPPAELGEQDLKAVPVPISRRGANPFAEARSLWALYRLFRHLRPDLVHLVTIKPVLYGGMMARLARVPAVVSAISGLGTLFTTSGGRAGLMRRVAQAMYRVALGHGNQTVILQNPDDRMALIREGGLREEKTEIIRGSGVDLEGYACHAEPLGTPVVVMAVRLLREKGIEEFIEAARLVVARGVQARFLVVGDPDPGNPSSVSAEDVDRWRAEGVAEFLGFRQDIARIFRESHVVVLPSYREGLPKVLIEAAACGRAVVTTDVPGCRDAIEDGETGVLVPVRDVPALADALQALVEDPERRQAMGRAGRALAEREFAIEKVVDAHLEIYRRLHGGHGG
ncbi:glycosyltransferase family 4 protein [Thioalkalivibrio sp. ALE17]|uniref:glycosyltransferase family 4 protein n=1 Tax=Thioalkalivibrio sp. ALE17 TaxID=1158173 RepID=UPI00048C9D07|nr:glycosyltransferase family 4 protein [Thioalkalivibrio sp. ALE17]